MHRRRTFLKTIVLGSAALNLLPLNTLAGGKNKKAPEAESKPLRFALIGKGGMGTSDTNTARRVKGVELVAVCDLYDKRLEDAKKSWGDHLFVTKDYKEILAMDDLDAVIIATPDHWHQQIAIDAMKANKHIYCEKPVIHKLKEGKELLKAHSKSKSIFHMGTQGISSFGNEIAQKLIQGGFIGKVNFVEAQFTAPPRALNSFSKPIDATEETIWWERFLGDAPKHDFDAQRFLAWRNWKDYGTGLAGDLFVHVISSLHFITGALGPEKVYTSGGLHYYKDGSRDTPDIMLGMFDYPDRNDIGAFKMSLGANIVDGITKKWGSSDIEIVGELGTLNVGWDKVTLKTLNDTALSNLEILKQVSDELEISEVSSLREFVFKEKKNFRNAHLRHFDDFFESIRENKPNVPDILFSLRTSSTALLSFESYLKGKAILWDADRMKIVS